MAQQTTSDNSGMGVVLGILLAVIIAVGAYFFMRGNEPGALEPAAGTEATATMDQPAATDGPATTTPAP